MYMLRKHLPPPLPLHGPCRKKHSVNVVVNTHLLSNDVEINLQKDRYSVILIKNCTLIMTSASNNKQKSASTYAQKSANASRFILLRFLSLRQKPTLRPDIWLCVWGPPAGVWQQTHTERGRAACLALPHASLPLVFPLTATPRFLLSSWQLFISNEQRECSASQATWLPYSCQPITTSGAASHCETNERESKKSLREVAPLACVLSRSSTYMLSYV